MMARRGMLGLTAGGAVASLSGCNPFGRNRYRYKMIVEVETPEGVKSGLAVRELEDSGSSWFPFGESTGRLYVKGEAVAVDVAPGRTLFALLTGQDGDVDYAGSGVSTIFRVMDRDTGSKGGPHELWPKVPTIREPITNPMPMLVTFADIDDPASVARVKPDDLAAQLGAGVRLKAIAVEITSDAVTTRIEKRLCWLPRIYSTMLDGSSINNSTELSNSLTQSAFVLGRKL